MQIVIELSEQDYELACKYPEALFYAKAIKNGTPLPKGHGRLIILSENKLKENQINLDSSCQKWISEVGLSNATVTIIDADKTESDASNFESDEYIEQRLENYNKMLKSGILDCVAESEDKT